MAENEVQVVELQDKFYQDSFGKLILIFISVLVAIAFLVLTSVYLYLNQPPPTVFRVEPEWRVMAPVPLDQPYLSIPDVSQWVADATRHLFEFDFNHYDVQLNAKRPYFTDDGWKVFQDQLNNYASANDVQTNKMFVNGVPSGAPGILNQGLLSGRYAWWVQIPVDIHYDYAGGDRVPTTETLTLQILVVRVSTLNNLLGVAIDNVVVAKNTENK